MPHRVRCARAISGAVFARSAPSLGLAGTSALALLLLACRVEAPVPARPAGVPEPPRAGLGAVVGDVSATTAMVWSRAEEAERMYVELWEATGPADAESGEPPLQERSVAVSERRDFTAQARFAGLAPNTSYRYRIRFVGPGGADAPGGAAVRGSFRTAPAAHARVPVRVAFGGDLAGQNVCRDLEEGFPIFEGIARWQPHLFVGLGDMIYADDVCRPVGRYGNAQVPGEFDPSAQLADFWAHWRYSREDRVFRELLRRTPYLAVWDDHEVVNDFGPHHDTRDVAPYEPGRPLLPLGLRAFLDYNPVDVGTDEPRLYRSARWGRYLELFALDTRQYRDPNSAPDDPAHPKSMLGAAQRAWLTEGLARSDATWKVVISSVPIAVPTGVPPERGRDGWADYDQATGFENELEAILRSAQRARVANLLWITTDVHFAQVLRYTPFDDAPGFHFHEVVVGPLNAGVFPNPELDPSFGPERLFYYAPESMEAVDSFETAKRWFNFGVLDVDAEGWLTVRVVRADGETMFSKVLAPAY